MDIGKHAEPTCIQKGYPKRVKDTVFRTRVGRKTTGRSKRYDSEACNSGVRAASQSDKSDQRSETSGHEPLWIGVAGFVPWPSEMVGE